MMMIFGNTGMNHLPLLVADTAVPIRAAAMNDPGATLETVPVPTTGLLAHSACWRIIAQVCLPILPPPRAKTT